MLVLDVLFTWIVQFQNGRELVSCSSSPLQTGKYEHCQANWRGPWWRSLLLGFKIYWMHLGSTNRGKPAGLVAKSRQVSLLPVHAEMRWQIFIQPQPGGSWASGWWQEPSPPFETCRPSGPRSANITKVFWSFQSSICS